MNKTTMLKILMLPVLMIAGCSNESERIARVATEAADRQAAQNQELARLNREVAEGTRRLVEADAQARREIVEVHKDLQGERGELSQQWNALETERQGIAHQRRTQSMLIPVAQAIALALLAALVIGFCWTLLFGLQQQDEADAQLAELLVRDVVSQRPLILPANPMRQAITQQQARQSLVATSDRLMELGVTLVNVEYDGYGDEETVISILAYRGEEEFQLPADITRAFDDAACEFLAAGCWASTIWHPRSASPSTAAAPCCTTSTPDNC